jgi:hypothetical protein
MNTRIAARPFHWMTLAWLWLDIPTILWCTGVSHLSTLLKSPLGLLSANLPLDRTYAALWYGLGVGFLIWTYQHVGQAWSQGKRPWGLIAVILMLSAVSFPFVSHDIFVYFGEWRTITIYHHNPMVTPIAAIPRWHRDVWLVRAGWQKSVNPYGPGWFLWLEGWSRILPQDFGAFFVWWKSMTLLGTTLSAWMLNKMRAGSGVRFLLHPVIGIEFLANGHNDVLMMVLAVLSLWLWRRKAWVWAGLAAGLSAAMKYVSVLPLAWLALKPQRWSQRFTVAGFAVAAGLLCLVPLWRGPNTLLGPLGTTHLYLRSPAFIVQGTLVHLTHLSRAHSRMWASLAVTAAFLALYVRAAHQFYKTQDPVYLGDALLATALVLMSWLQFWYLSWSLPFYLVSRRERAARLVQYLAYLEIVRTTGWPLGLPAALQILQVLMIWVPLNWILWPSLKEHARGLRAWHLRSPVERP